MTNPAWKPEGRRRFWRAMAKVGFGLFVLWALIVAALVVARRAPAVEAEEVPVRRIWVIDGDTIDLLAPGREVGRRGAADAEKPERIRLQGIDAPETLEPRCEAEKAKGLEAKRAAIALVRAGRMARVTRSGQDRFGRTLGTVAIDGQDLGRALLDRDLALPYRSGPEAKAARIAHWCGPGAW